MVLLLADAATIAWYSWEDEKAAAVHHLATITDLEARAFGGYFTYLENDLKSLGAALTKEDELIDLDQANERVRAFREAHSELYNATLILADGSLEVGLAQRKTRRSLHHRRGCRVTPAYPPANPTYGLTRGDFAIAQPILHRVYEGFTRAMSTT